MTRKWTLRKTHTRPSYSREFRQEAVQMVLDGHSTASVADRLGLSSTNLLYRWKIDVLGRAGRAARKLGDRVGRLENELRRVERERDIFKKALSILSRSG
jgi:transposase